MPTVIVGLMTFTPLALLAGNLIRGVRRDTIALED